MRPLRSRKLLWRLVLFGVIELIVIVGVSLLRFYLTDLGFEGDEIARKYEARIAQVRDDHRGLHELLGEIEREEGVETALLDASGRIVAVGGRRGLPGRGPPPGDWLRPPPGARRPQMVRVPIQTLHGTETLVVRRSRRQPPGGELWALAAIVFVVAGVALVFARDLAIPLEKLAATARAFGEGDLSARNNLRRKDELGEVAEAFDEMAGRVQALLQSQRELLANVSHELRTPLSRIQVALDIAAEGNAEAARESLAGIGEDLAELNRLIEDILAAARLETKDATGVPALRKESVTLSQLFAQSKERFAAKHKHKLELNVAPDLQLHADAMLLRRAFDNLIDNAGKYSEPSTTVAVTAVRAEGSAVVEIRDHGVGMDEAELKQLFTPFFRSDKSRARKTGGVGLGLLLARRVIEAHGGQLTVTSAPGAGTTVKATLPLGGA